MAFLIIPNDGTPASISGRSTRKAIVIQNRHAEPIYVNTVKSQLEADETDGTRLEQYQSFSLTGVRGEASVAFHIAKQIGVGAGTVHILEVV